MGMTGFNKPTLKTIKDRIHADIDSKLPELDTRLKNTVMNVMADTVTGLMYSLFGYLDWISDQTNVLYALDENLDKFGTIWGIQRKPPTVSSGTITVTGTDGSIITTGSKLQTADEIEYIVLSDATIVSGTAVVSIESIDTGTDQNQNIGTTLSFTAGITGVDNDAIVISLINGSAAENNEIYRQRIITRIDQAPHGGTKKDYVTWALENPNVTRAWTYPLENGAGTVVVRFMMDDTYSDGIPLTADVTSVQTYIDNVRPVTANLTVVAPVAVPLNITISNLVPNTPEIQASIEANLKDKLLQNALPGQKIFLSWIYEAISTATGESNHSVTFPTGDTAHLVSEIATLGTITYA